MIRKLTHMIHGSSKLPWFSLSLAIVSIALFIGFGGASQGLIYDRSAIETGEYWRLITGHFIHLDLQHLITNVGALLALGFLYETSKFGGIKRLSLGCFAMAGATISAALFLIDPDTFYYCGLSGILNSLFVLTTLALWRETRNKFWLIALSLAFLKVGYEFLLGPIFSSNLAWPPHIGSHVMGLVAGLLYANFDYWFERKRDKAARATAKFPALSDPFIHFLSADCPTRGSSEHDWSQ